MIRIYLLDYLENSLQPRLENKYLYPEEQAKYQQAYFEEPEQQTLALAAGNEETEQQTLALAAGNEETEQEKEAVWSIAGRWQDGMEYAVHVEAKGKDVAATGYIQCQEYLRKALIRVFEKI